MFARLFHQRSNDKPQTQTTCSSPFDERSVRIEPRPDGKKQRPGISYQLIEQPAYPGCDEYYMKILYNGVQIGHAIVAKSSLGEQPKGFLRYLKISPGYQGQGFSIDSIALINSLFKKWGVTGHLNNDVGSENPEWTPDKRCGVRGIYERMGWVAVPGSDMMVLPPPPPCLNDGEHVGEQPTK